MKRAISGLALVLILVVLGSSVAASPPFQSIPPHWQLTGWYTPNFWDNTIPDGQYAPTAYRHGHWIDSNTNEFVFASVMDWNQTRADNVRYYSNHLRFWVCQPVYMYYTHDHTDMSGKLHGVGAGTNIPNAKFDRDDDDGDGRYEEYEVVSLDQAFPTTNQDFYVWVTYYQKQGIGSGYLLETPALSAKAWCMSEYNTWRFDDNPQRLDYDNATTRTLFDKSSDSIAQTPSSLHATDPISQTISVGPVQLHMVTDYSAPRILVGAAFPMSTENAIRAYVDFVRSDLTTQLHETDVNQALTVVTFNEPVPEQVLENMFSLSSISQVEMIKAVYTDVNDPNPATNIWTLEAHPKRNTDYADSLSTLVSSITSMQLMPNRDDPGDTSGGILSSPHLEKVGFTAIKLWLPIEEIDHLNSHEMVFLADPLPTYARVLVSRTDEAARLRSMNDDLHQLPDGIESFIVADFTDLYPEMQFFSQER